MNSANNPGLSLPIKILLVIMIMLPMIGAVVLGYMLWKKSPEELNLVLARQDNPAVENFVSVLPTEKIVPPNVEGIVVPHHLLVAGFMDSFYSKIAASNKYDHVIILSPNHFGYGFSWIQTSDEIEGHQFNFDEENIEALVKSGLVTKEPKEFNKEHGVFAQENFLKRYFPDAKVLPIIIKNKTPREKLEKLAGVLTEMVKKEEDSGERVLVIGSLDFSHYSSEDAAVVNDKKSLNFLKNLAALNNSYKGAYDLYPSQDKRNPEAVGIDSPDTLFVMTQTMKNLKKTEFSLWNRTSSIALIPSTIDNDNTSHLFGSFR